MATTKKTPHIANTVPVLENLRPIDWTWIALAIIVPTGGLLLQVVNGEDVAILGRTEATLPLMCGSRAWLGINCPLCGVTRSIIDIMHGDFEASWAAHRLGWLIGLLIVAQVPYRWYGASRQLFENPSWRKAEAGIWSTVGILLILNRIWDTVG